MIVLITLHYSCTLLFFFFFFFLDDSDGEDRKLSTREEEDVDILRSWMEVEEKAQGLLTEVRKSSCSPLFFVDLPSISLVVLYVWIVTGYFLLLFLRV